MANKCLVHTFKTRRRSEIICHSSSSNSYFHSLRALFAVMSSITVQYTMAISSTLYTEFQHILTSRGMRRIGKPLVTHALRHAGSLIVVKCIMENESFRTWWDYKSLICQDEQPHTLSSTVRTAAVSSSSFCWASESSFSNGSSL